MSVNKTDIRRWFKFGKENGNVYMFVVQNAKYEHWVYPLFSKSIADAKIREQELRNDTKVKTMEIYDLREDMDFTKTVEKVTE